MGGTPQGAGPGQIPIAGGRRPPGHLGVTRRGGRLVVRDLLDVPARGDIDHCHGTSISEWRSDNDTNTGTGSNLHEYMVRDEPLMPMVDPCGCQIMNAAPESTESDSANFQARVQSRIYQTKLTCPEPA